MKAPTAPSCADGQDRTHILDAWILQSFWEIWWGRQTYTWMSRSRCCFLFIVHWFVGVCRSVISWKWSQLMCLLWTWEGRTPRPTSVSQSHTSLVFRCLLWPCCCLTAFCRFCCDGAHRRQQKQQDFGQWGVAQRTSLQRRWTLTCKTPKKHKIHTCVLFSP